MDGSRDSNNMRICATVLLGPGSESKVHEAITSVASAVDGFVLIESGGGYTALAVAREAVGAAEHVSAHMDWTGSYSDARNTALSLAERLEYDYAVTLDPDERLGLPEQLRHILGLRPEVKVWSLRDRDLGYCKERVLKCGVGLKWHGLVCENVEEREQVTLPGHFWELTKSIEGDRARWERGIVATRKMIEEGDDRYKWWRHQGSCHSGLGDQEQALACYEKALERAGNPEETAWTTYLICEQLVLRERFDEAHDKAAMALAHHAGFVTEFGSIMAYVQLRREDYQNASRWAQLAINCPADKTRVGNRGPNAKIRSKQILAILHSQPGPQ